MAETDKLLLEPRISFGDLARREEVNISTVWRWSLRGCKGHQLESFNVGGKKFTTLPAFERWLAKINGEKLPRAETPRQRRLATERAERELELLGA